MTEYKPGKSNHIADAFSRVFEEEEGDVDLKHKIMAMVSFPISEFLLKLRKENTELDEMVELHKQFQEGTLASCYTVKNVLGLKLIGTIK